MSDTNRHGSTSQGNTTDRHAVTQISGGNRALAGNTRKGRSRLPQQTDTKAAEKKQFLGRRRRVATHLDWTDEVRMGTP